jgi:hypothetical protein
MVAARIAITPSALEKKLSHPPHFVVLPICLRAMYWCLGVALAAGVESAITTPLIFAWFWLIFHDGSN